VLVVTAIGLALPAIGTAQADAARMRCSNNLHVIALAIHGYHDQFGDFPRTGVLEGAGLQPEDRLSWQVAVLPYLENEHLYRQFSLDKPWHATENRKLGSTSYLSSEVLRCPSAALTSSPAGFGLTSYVGISGVGLDAASLPPDDLRCGLFGHERRISKNDVKDGTANTLMLIETQAMNGPWVAAGDATVRGVDPAQRPYIDNEGPFGIAHSRPSFFRMGKPNVWSAIAAMADCSVRTIRSSISPRTFEALATIAGGDEIPPDF
jgi:hypothetical protein